MNIKCFYVYILASRTGGAIYIGVTSDLIKRVSQHKHGITKGHTNTYHIKQLVYYELYETAEEAILREKRLKKWTRAMKNDLINKHNPLWEDLYTGLNLTAIPARGARISLSQSADREVPASAGTTKE